MAETSHVPPSLAMDERGGGRASQRLGGGGVEPAPLDVSVIDAVEATPLKPSVLAVDRGRHAGGAGGEAAGALRPLFPAGPGAVGVAKDAGRGAVQGRGGVEGSDRLSGLEQRLALVSAVVGGCSCAIVGIGVRKACAIVGIRVRKAHAYHANYAYYPYHASNAPYAYYPYHASKAYTMHAMP